MKIDREGDALLDRRASQNSIAFSLFALFLSLAFLGAVPIAMQVTGIDHTTLWENLFRICTSPSKLVTDYFRVGCLASTLFNAGACGLACNILILISRTRASSTTFAAYILVIAHCFYGLNFINMWPPFIGVIIYCFVTRHPLRKNLHVAMFSTALAPFISDFLFCYPLGIYLPLFGAKVNVVGLGLSLVFGFVSGFLVPALLPGTTAMHRGFNMYKAGLALGMFGIFVYCFLYSTLGIEPPDAVQGENALYESFGHSYWVFMNVFFAAIFTLSVLLGFFLNGRRFRGYGDLLKCTGYGLDFADKFGMPMCFINFGVYGFCILAYLNLIFLLPVLLPFLPDGVGFTGPTVGVTFAALTFSADGQHPKNVAPIAGGYVLLFLLVCGICAIFGNDIPWTLSTQAYINGLAFATGLCPIAGKYGWKYGILAGLVSAIICNSTAAMHGGFVLYNGGFNAGLTALILIPILDFYHIEPRYSDDE
jgi:hypothetical protein